jgi:hypothetical protein
MIKVVCIKNAFSNVSLTVNKVYDAELVEYQWGEFYLIRNDEGLLMEYSIKKCNFYFYDYFITLAEWREKQIKSIIDE